MIPTAIPPGAAAAHLAIVPAYQLSETALKLSQVIEREANRRSALTGSRIVRVEQNFPMFRRMSSHMRSSVGRSSVRSVRSKRSVTSIVTPTPEDVAVHTTLLPTIDSGPLQPIRSSSPSLPPSPRASVRVALDSSADAIERSQASEAGGPEEPLTLRGRVWEFFDDPQSSPCAYYFSISLFFFITLSTMVFIAQTDRSLARHRHTLSMMETICAIVFTVEYSLRALTAPSKWHFIKNLGNWVDLAAILPFYLEAILEVENAGSFGAIRIVRLTRVARVLKMSRYSSAIQVFVQAIAISIKALSMLVFLMAIAVVVFSSAIYFAEYTPDGCRSGGWIGECDGTNEVIYAGSLGRAAAAGASNGNDHQCVCVDPNPYSSIAESFWWSVVTMSTVGYGDMTPVTVPGRIVGTATILTGMLVLALPVTVIGTNFQKVMKSVMQQTMKSNVDYLKGKKQICREEIQAILQRFHAVTTDIHLNIDDIIQVYDTDNSGTLEDDELARFRHDLEMLQNRAFMNQHMDLHTPAATVAIATPLGAPDQRSSPTKAAMGALMRKLSSKSDLFTRPTPAPASPPPQQEPANRQTIAVAPQARPISPVGAVPPMIRPSHSQPSQITSIKETARESPEPAQHPLGVERDIVAEAAALIAKQHAPGPSIEELETDDDQPNASASNADPHTQTPVLQHCESSRSESPSDSPKHHTHRTSHSHHRASHRHHHDDVLLQRLADMQRKLESRLLESEARLESKILNLTKIVMRVEKLIEMND